MLKPLNVVKQEYEDIVKNEVQRAISADEDAIGKLCARAAKTWGISPEAVVWENGHAKPSSPNSCLRKNRSARLFYRYGK